MTVSYNLTFSRTSWKTIFKIIFKWRGSVWKSVWRELLMWLLGYYFIFFLYRSEFILNVHQQRTFELVHLHIRNRIDWIPMNFLLGFFVSMIVDRWRQIFMNMGFIENLAMSVATLFRNKDEEDVHTRRAVVRYLCLAQVLAFRDISLKVRKRFPNLDAIVKGGFMEEHEKVIYEGVRCDFNKYWIPINWACAISIKARETGRVMGDNYLQGILQELKNFRTALALLCNFDWVPVPLAYPQLVMCAVRIYFLLCIVARQYIIGIEAVDRNEIDLYFPFMTVLQFIFYVGWTKIAESLLNPMGEDDDHFECNVLIDRNIQTGLAIVDDTFDVIPKIIPDRFRYQPPMYTEETAPKEGASYNTFAGSVAHIVLAEDDESIDMVGVETYEEEVPPSTAASRKPSIAARFNNTLKKKMSIANSSFRPRRMSRFSTRIVPSSVVASQSQSASPIPTRMNTVRRASEIPWTSHTEKIRPRPREFDDFNNSIDTRDFPNPFGNSLSDLTNNRHDRTLSRRPSVTLDAVSEESHCSHCDAAPLATPKASTVKFPPDQLRSRHPTIGEEDEDHSSGTDTVTDGDVGPSTPTRRTVAATAPASSSPSTAVTPPLTPRGILKKRSGTEKGHDFPSFRPCRSEPQSGSGSRVSSPPTGTIDAPPRTGGLPAELICEALKKKLLLMEAGEEKGDDTDRPSSPKDRSEGKKKKGA